MKPAKNGWQPKRPAGSESYDENGNLFSENQLYLMWGKKNDYRTLTSNAQLIRGQSDKKVQYFVLDQTDGEWSSRLKKQRYVTIFLQKQEKPQSWIPVAMFRFMSIR